MTLKINDSLLEEFIPEEANVFAGIHDHPGA